MEPLRSSSMTTSACGRCLFRGALLSTSCARCTKTLNHYNTHFEREYNDAVAEYVRLRQLFKDVCWYNFEVTCREWSGPWRTSDPDSVLCLHGMQFENFWVRGTRRERGTFPTWYNGTVEGAPALPPKILQTEVEDARKHMVECQKRKTAAVDWAPGGEEYNRLVDRTMVGRITVPYFPVGSQNGGGDPG